MGDALDNALMASTIGLFTIEVADHEHHAWMSWRQVEQATASWVRWYNHERLHSSIGDIPPAEYEDNYYALARGHDNPLIWQSPQTHRGVAFGRFEKGGEMEIWVSGS